MSKHTNAQRFDSALAEWQDFKVTPMTARTEKVPAGWLSVEGFAALKGITRASANGILSRGRDSGQLERKAFRVITGYGVRAVFHYRNVK